MPDMSLPPVIPWDIGVDVDGVLYDFIGALREHITGSDDPEILPFANSWEFYKKWGLTDQQFLNHYSEGVHAGKVLWEGQPYANTREGWDTLLTAGHRIHIITDRQPPGAEEEAMSATRHWLASHDLNPTSVVFSADKTHILHLAQDGKRVAFIDDRPENVHALRAAGILAFIMNRPWNQDVQGERVNDLLEFANIINVLAKKNITLGD